MHPARLSRRSVRPAWPDCILAITARRRHCTGRGHDIGPHGLMSQCDARLPCPSSTQQPHTRGISRWALCRRGTRNMHDRHRHRRHADRQPARPPASPDQLRAGPPWAVARVRAARVCSPSRIHNAHPVSTARCLSTRLSVVIETLRTKGRDHAEWWPRTWPAGTGTELVALLPSAIRIHDTSA